MNQTTYRMWGSLFLWALITMPTVHGAMKSRLIVKRKNPVAGIMRNQFKLSDKQVFKYSKDQDMKSAKKAFEADSDVEWVVEDTLMEHFFVPGDAGTTQDTYWYLQWHYHDNNSGINLPAAWDITLGAEVVVAVVDTGITNHPDLGSKILQGADMITNPSIANDGDGRDNNANDPGDWVTVGDPCFNGQRSDSSWHGTHVAGTIAAKSGNGIGVSGVSWNAKIVPVRVLGKCGGWSSDIADGIKWAAGIPVAGVANNANPARVINLSLGGRGDCNPMMQEAIDEANAAGSLIVVAAGNSNNNIDFIKYSPANCKGVITVAATDENSDRSFFSNYGEFIDVAAPGGGEAGIFSTYNSGKTYPATSSYKEMKGTSMSSPHVAGVAALMIGANPGLSPAQLRSIIVDSAKSFERFSSCDESICGGGIVDAEAAVLMALSTTGDPDFVFNEPVISATSEPVTVTWFLPQNDEEGAGACGSVGMSSGNGSGPFGMSLLFGILLSLMFGKLSSNFRIYKTW